MSPNRDRLILFLFREIAENRSMVNDAFLTLFPPTPEDLLHNTPARLGNVQKVEDRMIPVKCSSDWALHDVIFDTGMHAEVTRLEPQLCFCEVVLDAFCGADLDEPSTWSCRQRRSL